MKLSCYQFKIGLHLFKIFYVSLMVTMGKSCSNYTTQYGKESKHTDTKRHQNTKRDS